MQYSVRLGQMALQWKHAVVVLMLKPEKATNLLPALQYWQKSQIKSRINPFTGGNGNSNIMVMVMVILTVMVTVMEMIVVTVMVSDMSTHGAGYIQYSR